LRARPSSFCFSARRRRSRRLNRSTGAPRTLLVIHRHIHAFAADNGRLAWVTGPPPLKIEA
jgi:hypothetical protein